MARQCENDQVEREIAEAFKPVSRLRPSHRIVHMWRDLEACLQSIRQLEFLLGYTPLPLASAVDFNVDHEAVQMQFHDVRSALGALALALAEEAEA